MPCVVEQCCQTTPPSQIKGISPVPSYPAVVNRIQFTSPHVRKENKNRGSSRFNISLKREIQKLPPLKGDQCAVCSVAAMQDGGMWCVHVRSLYCFGQKMVVCFVEVLSVAMLR